MFGDDSMDSRATAREFFISGAKSCIVELSKDRGDEDATFDG